MPQRIGSSSLSVRTLAAVRRDAVRSGVPAGIALAIGALPLVGGLIVAATAAHPPLFIWILQDDHPVEWLQFGLCLFASVVAALAALRFGRQRAWQLAGLLALFGLGMFVLAGEEISWGQRALGFATPAGLEGANLQSEFNVHNVSAFGLSDLTRVAQTLLALGGTVLPLLTRLDPPWVGAHWLRVLSGPLFLVPAFALALAFRMVRYALAAIGRTPDAALAYTEWAELSLIIGLAGVAVFAHAGAGPGHHTPLNRPVVLAAGAAAAVTVVLAILTLGTGIQPGNR